MSNNLKFLRQSRDLGSASMAGTRSGAEGYCPYRRCRCLSPEILTGLGLLVGCWSLALSPPTVAQTAPPILRPLPPPPQVPLPNPPTTPDWPAGPMAAPPETETVVEPNLIPAETKSSTTREINWHRPQSNLPLLGQSQLYRVEVYGVSELTLARVRTIAPQAFVRRTEGVIQVGLFQDQQLAEALVYQLAKESLWSRIVIVGSAPK